MTQIWVYGIRGIEGVFIWERVEARNALTRAWGDSVMNWGTLGGDEGGVFA
jgi:hypothetical protein